MAPEKSHMGRIVIIGDSEVGKTTLLRTYLTPKFEYSEKYSMTLGVVPNVTEIKLLESNTAMKFLFYDTTGSDVYYALLPKYRMTPDIVLVVYDVSSSSSFANLNHWFETIKSFEWSNNSKSLRKTVVLFANKVDLIDRRVISAEMGEKFADQLKTKYFEGSAKTNEGVCEMFQWLAYKCFSERKS